MIRGSTLEALAALILSVSIATAAHAFGCTVSTTPINFGGYDTLSHNGASAVATIKPGATQANPATLSFGKAAVHSKPATIASGYRLRRSGSDQN